MLNSSNWATNFFLQFILMDPSTLDHLSRRNCLSVFDTVLGSKNGCRHYDGSNSIMVLFIRSRVFLLDPLVFNIVFFTTGLDVGFAHFMFSWRYWFFRFLSNKQLVSSSAAKKKYLHVSLETPEDVLNLRRKFEISCITEFAVRIYVQ